MLRYLTSRILQNLLVVLAVFTLTFFAVRLAPGSPFRTGERSQSAETEKAMMERFGFDKPWFPQQYFDALGSYAKGDLMYSVKLEGVKVNKIVGDGFPISLTIGLISLAVALGLGLPAGIIAAVKKNQWLDWTPMSLAMVGICLPTFVMAPVLVWIFSLQLGWLNVAGWYERSIDWILPSVSMGLYYAANVARLTRGGMLEVLNQDFIRTARAKGAGPVRVVLVHALRGGLVPVVTFLGPAIAGVVGGSFIIEKIFQLPGLGQHLVASVSNRDYSLLQGIVVIYTLILVTMNLLVDVLLVWMNPRLRLS